MSANPFPFRWSVEAYERVVALGGFPQEKRVELIEGELVEIMPQKPAHRITVSLILPIALSWSGDGHHVLCQSPLRLVNSVPEPDISIVAGQPRDYAAAHPTTAALVVEVSDTTLEYDQTVKAAIYAAAGIEDYWIVNINERTVEVRRQPGPSSYRSLQTYTETDTIAPLFNPTASILVADLLP
ncbi:MAG: Uma2 family endonuclease [Armatimonadetes bacterium]|nr:Uma2 family endonuclease [Armatimonadota bacterium]